jgi:hypothetical protein
MRTIDLVTAALNLDDLLLLAAKENIHLRTPEGREFILAGIDDLEPEIELIGRNEELIKLLAERSNDRGTPSLEQVKAKLGLS